MKAPAQATVLGIAHKHEVSKVGKVRFRGFK